MTTEIRTRLTADTSDFQRSMSQAQRTATKTTSSMKSSFSGVSSSIGAMVKGAGAIGLAIGALEAAASLISGPSVSNVAINFAKVANSVGADSEKMMAALKRASLGMVSDMELMTKASQAMTLGIDPKLIVQMMEAATASSKTMGISVSHAFESIAIGVARQSRLILDNVGIIVKSDEAYAAYAKTVGKTVDQLTAQEKTLAFNQAAMVGLKKQVEIVGATTEGTMGETAQFLTTVKNLWDKIGDSVKSFINFGLKPVNMFLDKIKKNLQASGVYKFDVPSKPGSSIMTGEVQNAGLINGNGYGAGQDREKIKKMVSDEKDALAEILKARADFAVKFAELQDGEKAKDLVKLAQWRDKSLSIEKLTAEDKMKVMQIYNLEVAKIEQEAEEKLDALMESHGSRRNASQQYQRAQDLKALDSWYGEVLDKTDDGDKRRIEALKIYNEEKAAIESEARSQLNDLILEQSSMMEETDKLRAERELEDLELWYEEVLELTSEGDEARLEALKIYLERRRILTEEATSRELSHEKTFIENAKAADKAGADFMKDVTRDKWETVSFLGEAALKTGTTLGKKIFLASKAVAAAQVIVDTSQAVMKTLARYGGTPFGYAQAAVVAAIGAAQLAAVVSSAIGATSSSGSSVSGGGGGGDVGSGSISGVTPVAPTEEKEKGSLTINIQGDIMNADYIDLLAERINEAVSERNVLLKSTTAREIGN